LQLIYNFVRDFIIIIIIIITTTTTTTTILLLLTAIELSLGGSSLYTSTKQIGINIHKRNNTKNPVQTIQNTVNTSTVITKTPPHTHTHTLQNKLKQPQYKIHTK